MNIRQLQVSYVAEHDRILTRINSTEGAEVRMWLTRRLVRRLWPGLVKASETAALERTSSGVVPGEARGMMAEMAREATLSQADFATPFDRIATHLPLGEEPLLITRIDFSPQKDGHVAFAFRQDEQRGLQMNMGPELLHAFCSLIQSEAAKAEWDFTLGWSPAQAGVLPASTAIN